MASQPPGVITGGRPALHQRHRFKVRAGFIRRSSGMDYCQTTCTVNLLQRSQCRVQSEETIQINRPELRSAIIGAGDGKHWASRIVFVVAMWHDDIQAISSTSQEDADQCIAAWANVWRSQYYTRHPTGQRQQRQAESSRCR